MYSVSLCFGGVNLLKLLGAIVYLPLPTGQLTLSEKQSICNQLDIIIFYDTLRTHINKFTSFFLQELFVRCLTLQDSVFWAVRQLHNNWVMKFINLIG